MDGLTRWAGRRTPRPRSTRIVPPPHRRVCTAGRGASVHGSMRVLICVGPRRAAADEGISSDPVEREHVRARGPTSPGAMPSSRTASGMSVANTCATRADDRVLAERPRAERDGDLRLLHAHRDDRRSRRGGGEDRLQSCRGVPLTSNSTSGIDAHRSGEPVVERLASAEQHRLGGAERPRERAAAPALRSTAMTRAPAAAAANVMNEPMPPEPTITASSPALSPLRRTACTAIDIGCASPRVSGGSPESETSSRMSGGHGDIAGESPVDLQSCRDGRCGTGWCGPPGTACTRRRRCPRRRRRLHRRAARRRPRRAPRRRRRIRGRASRAAQ